MKKLHKSDDQWRKELTSEQYRIARLGGTEPAFTGAYVNEKSPGVYRCAACGLELFTSDTKYDSGSGWPSFWDVAAKQNVVASVDQSHGVTRMEARCARCDAHLGHVFPDGPQPTGQRYCVNSAVLELVQRDDLSDDRT